MTSLAVTLIGTDRPGIIQDVAEVATQHGANWLESQMADLAGQFAGIVHLDVPAEQAEPLMAALKALAKDGLQINSATTAASVNNKREITLQLMGQDSPGIVRDIASALSSIGVSIAELETDTQSGSMSGEAMFKAEARLRLPDGLTLNDIDEKLAGVSNDLMVDIILNESDVS